MPKKIIERPALGLEALNSLLDLGRAAPVAQDPL
jgi:hypothetical protein